MSSGQTSDREATLRETVRFAEPTARRIVLASLLGAGAIAAGIGLLATSAWLISRASQHPRESAVALAVVAVQFFGLSRGLFRYGQRLVSHDAAFRALADVRVSVYERLEPLAPAGLPAFRSGDLLARLIHDVEALQDLLVRVIPPFIVAALVGGVTILLVWWVLPLAGLIMLVALATAATAIPWLTGRLARRSESRQAAARGQLTAAIVDLVRGGPELAAHGALKAHLERTSAIDAELRGVANATARTAGIGQGLATLLPGLAMVGALLVGVIAVHAGRLNGVLLAVIAVVPLAAFELVVGLPVAAQTLQRSRRSLARLLEVTSAEPVVIEPRNPRPLGPPPHTLRVRGLRARYRDDGPWVLDGLDLDLAAGRRVAVVGRSGAGKSTLAHVLLRFVPYQAGSVRIDDIEVDELSGEDCRQVIGLVAQDAHIFNATLEQNLRVARPLAMEVQIRAALQGARLLEWTEELPGGLGTEVGEYGARMSGGQRQRLAVARALLADFPVLILDEPGEHLDTPTADAIVADLMDATPNQAVLLITHRLVGLEAVDEVIVLDAGRVKQRGTHDQLLAEGGTYAEMWEREVVEP